MATNAAALMADIIKELKAEGFATGNEFAQTEKLAAALGRAVYKHMTLLDDNTGTPASTGHK
ncbi:hypothetical protein DSLASN_01320 [Desulfoluna limicola]|uniref:Uncharacterized protein n=1 Tax=Desulfoluna limicola TaxID=2810562 RepID=A0ABM7PBN6_9BACT|nr:hypothetical protein [Desulfoluna limicola]BCS94500.1 hypothetical protein DSLASN_01320 [Desulfoluna limicola]